MLHLREHFFIASIGNVSSDNHNMLCFSVWRTKTKGQHKAGLGSAGAVGLGQLSSAGHAHVVQPGPPHPSLEDEHLFRLLRHWHRLSLATTGGVPHGLGWAHTARKVRVSVAELVG